MGFREFELEGSLLLKPDASAGPRISKQSAFAEPESFKALQAPKTLKLLTLLKPLDS